MTIKSNSKPASAIAPLGLAWLAVPKPPATAFGNSMASWPEYMVDAFQRSVLFLDLLRQRGNEEIEITSRPMATVLRFDHEVLMSGRSLPRPINYHLSRIVPPPGSRDRPAQAARRGGGPAGRPGPRHRRLQGGQRDRRCPQCRPSGLFHRLRRGAGAGPAVPRRRRGTGEILRAGGRASPAMRRARLPSATARPAIRR